MHISFDDEKLRKEFEDERVLKRIRGAVRAKKIKVRMTQIEAATTLVQLRGQPGRFHELKGDLKGFLACDLDGPYRLIFAPANNPVPTLTDGSLDWSKVTSICIHGVRDYHD